MAEMTFICVFTGIVEDCILEGGRLVKVPLVNGFPFEDFDLPFVLLDLPLLFPFPFSARKERDFPLLFPFPLFLPFSFPWFRSLDLVLLFQ